jgi:hypothetical protein
VDRIDTDGFHITVLEQHACSVAHHDEAAGSRLLAERERGKWLLTLKKPSMMLV